jgi:SAM-dependent methyltransferase
VQFASVRLAHRGQGRATPLKAFSPWDVLVAKRLSAEITDGSVLLDVGCGNGHRLHEVALFRDLKSACGVDVVPPSATQSTASVQLMTFDGQNLPFADKSVDVSMICYVLHHLHPEHVAHMLKEALRVSSRKIIVLEDSLPTWTPMYRLRNWAHRVDADLEYTAGADTYQRTEGQAMFLTHDEWMTYLSQTLGVRRVTMESLHPLMEYRHHTMFVLEIA